MKDIAAENPGVADTYAEGERRHHAVVSRHSIQSRLKYDTPSASLIIGRKRLVLD